jgi:DNA-binding winged helix-turn-helix (wHTH) protein
MAVVRFRDLTLDPEQALLVGPDGPIAVEPQVFAVLVHLATRPGRLVTKEELLDEVWGSRFVTESSLTSRIRAARRAVGDDGRRQEVIATVHGRGYRFVADVESDDGDADPAAQDAQATVGARTGDRPGWPRPRVLPAALRVGEHDPFVGRDDELATAIGLVDDPDPRTHVLWLLGEPGIGKTRLAAQLAAHADRAGRSVLFGRCDEDLAVPLQPIAEMLEATASGLGEAELRERLGPHPAELQRLLPGLGDALPDLPATSSGDASAQRHRLFQAVVGWLDAGAAVRRQVLVVDDAHWATESTLQLLGHVARSGHGGGTRIIVTARDTSPDSNDPLATLVESTTADGTGTAIRLSGLDRDAVRALVDMDADLALSQTAGNPLLLRALDGQLDGGGVDGAVRRRLSRIDARARETLAVAAITGLDFDLPVVAAAVGRPELDVLDELEQAVEARLVEEIGIDRFRFAHALVRASLRDGFSASRRARLHARVASALEEVHAGDLRPVAGAVVQHLRAAGVRQADRARLRRAALVAADRARELLSFEEADALFGIALGATSEDDARGRAEVLLARGTTRSRAGLHVPAADALAEAHELAVAAGEDAAVVSTAIAWVDASWRTGASLDAGEPMLRAAAPLVAPDDRVTLARVAMANALVAEYAGRVDDAAAEAARADELVRSLGDPRLEAEQLSTTMLHLSVLRDPAQRAHHRTRVLALAEELDDSELAMLGHHFELVDLAISGRMATAVERIPAQRERADRLHSRFFQYNIAVVEAMAALYVGDLDRAAMLADAALDVSEAMEGEDRSGTHGLQMFLIRREQGRLGPLRGPLQLLRQRNDVGAFWTPGLAALYVELHEPDEAEQVLVALAGDAPPRPPRDSLWPLVMSFLVDVAVAVRRTDWCRDAYVQLEELAGQAVVAGHGLANLGSVDRLLGALARCLDLPEVAEVHLRTARERDAAEGSVLWAGHATVELARLHRDQGRPDEAAALAAEVLDDIQGRGMTRLEGAAAQMQVDLG